MRLRVIQAADTREAIGRMRADLGPDALILSTRATAARCQRDRGGRHGRRRSRACADPGRRGADPSDHHRVAQPPRRSDRVASEDPVGGDRRRRRRCDVDPDAVAGTRHHLATAGTDRPDHAGRSARSRQDRSGRPAGRRHADDRCTCRRDRRRRGSCRRHGATGGTPRPDRRRPAARRQHAGARRAGTPTPTAASSTGVA